MVKRVLKIISFIIGTYLLLSIFVCLYLNTSIVSKIDHWQQLIGSLLGAGTPLGLYLFADWQDKKKKRKEFLFLLEKNIISAINNLSDIDKMLHRFVDVQLGQYKQHIEEDDKIVRYSVGQAFIPLSYVFTLEKDFFKQSSGSSYLENLIMDTVNTSQELPLLLQDLSRQFDRTMSLNLQIGLLKLNSPQAHNQGLRENIAIFEKFINEQTFVANIPIYLRKLVSTKVALQKMNVLGLKGWKKTFNFKSPFTIEVSQKMTDYFKPEVNKQIEMLRSSFKSKLLLVGEELPNM